jgi:acyl-CoA reductase-like NAD-dependent aldehyde dehydrogenase
MLHAIVMPIGADRGKSTCGSAYQLRQLLVAWRAVWGDSMKLHETYPYYLANRPQQPNADLAVTNKFNGEIATRVALADATALDQAIDAAARAAAPMRRLAAWQRKAVLQHLAARCRERAEESAETLTIEAGKPIKFARGEVDRLIDTVEIAAEESTRIYGEVLPLDISQRADGYRGMWKRVPLGPCAFITPWNFPLNLVAHKIAPALACGCPFVLKPASATPIGALLLGEILAETDLPTGAFSILPMKSSAADALVEDERIKKLSFTGSPEVGWQLRDRARFKQVTLELGGNAAVIIERDADVEDAVARCIFGGYYQSGQSCISVQRILVQESVYGVFRAKFVSAVKALKMGDPRLEDTFIGPIINEEEAIRIERKIEQAVERGATLISGGGRKGVMVEPTVLENVPESADAWCEEIFGPVTALSRFAEFDDAIATVNNSRYGLQAGVFTRDVDRIQRAWDELEVGGVMVNEVPSWRVDHMPYGGTKHSGLGREGIRWAIESLTEPRLLVIRTHG